MKNIIKYLVRLLLVFLTLNLFNSCNEEETLYVFDNVSAPSDLSVKVEAAGDFDETVTITPIAQDVSQFKVYFGESENETPVIVSVGESISYTYSSYGEYLIKVLAVGSTGLTSEFSTSVIAGEEVVVEEEILQLPIDHESETLTYAWSGFGNATPTVIENPDASGNNTSATVLEVVKAAGAETWAGTALGLDTIIDFSETSNVSVNVWSPRADTPILFKVENADASLAAEVMATTTTAGAWETLIFDMSTSVTGEFNAENEYTTVIVFPDFGNIGADETYYFDDIQLTNEMSSGNDTNNDGFVDFETEITNELGGFGSATSTVVANPDASGINTSATVLEIDKAAGAETWAGVFLSLDGPVDFSTSTLVTLKFWSPRADTPILLKFENVDNTASIEVGAVSTIANEWEEITIDMSTSTNMALDTTVDYVKIVLFADFDSVGNGEQFYFDDIELSLREPSDVVTQALPQLPLDMEPSDIAFNWGGFGNATPLVVENPDASGLNTSATVLELDKAAGAETWAGIFHSLDGGVDFSSTTVINFKYWSPRAGTTVLVKFENADNTAAIEVAVTSTLANTWEELSVDMSTSTVAEFDPAVTYEKLVLFADFDNAGNGEKFYFDDITLN